MMMSAESGRKTFAALGSARINNGAATTGRHACPKAMPACSLQTAGLKSTLHFRNLDLVEKMTAKSSYVRPTQEANSILKQTGIQEKARFPGPIVR